MRQPLTPGVAYKRVRRSQHVVNILVKHGFGNILGRIRIWECVHFERGILKRECAFPELTAPMRLRMALEEMGPTFIKLGQMLSTRPDLVPRDFIVELKKLQSSAHFLPAETIRSVIEEELGKPISEVFDSFEDKPLAAASLAQVHRAVYKGQQVVLKVQRPGVEEMITLDADIMRGIAEVAERYSPRLYPANPVGLVDELADQIMRELDFRQEANNQEHFGKLFANDETIHVPKLYRELSTKRLITMEFLQGINISDTKRLTDEGYDRQLIAKRGAIIEFKAVFEHGFFHADPHPGNIFVMKDNVIGLIDFGLMAGLTLRDRERLAKLVYFIAVRDERRVARALNELMQSEETIAAEDLEPAMSDILKQYADVPTRDLHLAGMLYAMMRSIIAHHGRFRPELIWITKSIATQEDVAHSLAAEFNLAELGRPYAQKVLTRRLHPVNEAREFTYWMADALDVLREVPYDLGVIFRQAKKGRFKIEFEHIGLEPIRRTISRSTNRLSLTILIAALLISSSMVVIAGAGPLVGGIPLISFIGYLFAIFFSILLAWSVWFHSG